jgi:hypothetical protein
MESPYFFRIRFWIILFTIGLFLHLVIGCNYYQINTAEGNDYNASLNEALEDNKFILIYTRSATYEVDKIELNDQHMIVELDTISDRLVQIHDEVKTLKGNRYIGAKHRPIISEVRVYIDEDFMVDRSTTVINYDMIQSVEIYDNNGWKSFGLVMLVYMGVAAIFSIIVLLTKSSCPFIYSYDGEKFQYEGESYGGAIFKPLERTDFFPLNHIDTVNQLKSIRISNELKERQFINEVDLVEIRVPEGSTALMDRHGQAYAINSPIPPLTALADGTDFKESLQRDNQQAFIFHTGEELSNIVLEFPNEQKEAKLVINAKGSLWLDYLYGEFSKLFGKRYTDFIDKQNGRNSDELNEWVHKQNLLLSVYEETDQGWNLIDRFDMVGPLTKGRDLVMKIPPNHSGKNTRKLKLETGFMFWDLNSAGLDYSPNQIHRERVIEATEAIDHEGIDQVHRIRQSDTIYMEQPNVGNHLTVNFETGDPGNDSLQTCYFLKIRGYYQHVRDFEGDVNFVELIPFKNAGYFSEFSRSAYARFNTNPVALNSEAP